MRFGRQQVNRKAMLARHRSVISRRAWRPSSPKRPSSTNRGYTKSAGESVVSRTIRRKVAERRKPPRPYCREAF